MKINNAKATFTGHSPRQTEATFHSTPKKHKEIVIEIFINVNPMIITIVINYLMT
jgi:hypothetical protein